MSSQICKIKVAAATLALVLGCSTHSQAASSQGGTITDALAKAQTAPDYQLAMMDEMMKMGAMPGMDPGKMASPMPTSNAMPSSASSMQNPMTTPSSMDMMGRMRGSMQMPQSMNNMTPAGQLPGFPGSSHLYHMGATGFFLDHPQHINLSTVQQTNLNRIKEKVLLEHASTERRIEEAEQELWTLTAADSPDTAKIEAKVQAIEKLRSTERMVFIRAVGEAGNILTPDQRAALLGTKPTMAQPSPSSKPIPSTPASIPDKPMPDKSMAPMPDM